MYANHFSPSFLIVLCRIQGPFLYSFYADLAYSDAEIATLFVTGFASSLVFGTLVGPLADKYGRKKMCLLFTLLYPLACIAMYYKSYSFLLFGRMLGGIATSILHSVFEAWMTQEHLANTLPKDLLSDTFSKMTTTSGFAAIIAGISSQYLVDYFGLIAPFAASSFASIAAGICILLSWKENYGSGSAKSTPFMLLKAGLGFIWNSEAIIYSGLIQVFFEAAMFVFVFVWTPALEYTDGAIDRNEIPHGLIFSTFMIAIMIGSRLFQTMQRKHEIAHFSRFAYGAAALALAVPIYSTSVIHRLIAFTIFEVCCGLYFPAIGVTKSKHFPESVRSTITNIFRVALNGIVVSILLNIRAFSTNTIFTFAVCLASMAMIAQNALTSRTCE